MLLRASSPLLLLLLMGAAADPLREAIMGQTEAQLEGIADRVGIDHGVMQGEGRLEALRKAGLPEDEAALAAREEAEPAAALEESARLEDEARRPAEEQAPPAGSTGDPLLSEEQPVAALSLADANFDTGRAAVPESTLGGETTCTVCFTRPKDHVAIPCGHQCACADCSAKMEQCPICRQSVLMWMDSSRIRLA
ncbi:hypothetical protein EMIHUDRAFT_220633 [Emiliania huxleyi CCMP1516]|uniref:RING-type domain-containing protein n=2 Tax=Emiliania huxleyi TaxID=2903 RepID=A0A0D3I0R5_EMIH1|nr:hypothetical protein EMIHUDRAFT_220633 [Emiliania huxleyi CCMP1516]EOD04850.1 hypothetical protein EMIHUDRAFT_220633 [Emiliania huxleyi CCMP1516]|eukprot:XP_005757279.1 hypothetical protein EMIHUDRAFT_220633 [Emiliania huxleyi CCMP1516]